MKNKLNFCIAIFFCFTTISSYAQYHTGQRVFKDKFPSEIKDSKQDTYIKIENSPGDIIVAVENTYTGRVIQHAYILSNDVYEFRNIPVGNYVCKYMWTDNNGRKRFQKDNSTMEFPKDQYGGYIIQLTQTPLGNLSQSSISENEFFD